MVTTKSDNDFVELIVSDNGTGIPDEVKDKIFNPFFTSKPTGEGTGLGLSVSYDIIKQHGGKIHAESIFGDGTSFHIYLPLNHSTKVNNNAISKDIQSA